MLIFCVRVYRVNLACFSCRCATSLRPRQSRSLSWKLATWRPKTSTDFPVTCEDEHLRCDTIRYD